MNKVLLMHKKAALAAADIRLNGMGKTNFKDNGFNV
jgi:hypothetical protein